MNQIEPKHVIFIYIIGYRTDISLVLGRIWNLHENMIVKFNNCNSSTDVLRINTCVL